MPETQFLLLDGRAKSGTPERASVLDTADTEEEARKEGRSTWKNHDAIWFQYDIQGEKLINGRERWDIPPATDAQKSDRKGNKRRKK